MKMDLKVLQQIVLNVPNYIFWKDKNLIYQGCNYNFANAVGFKHPEQIVGKSDDEMPWSFYSAKLYQAEDLEIITTGRAILEKEVPMVTKEHEKILLVSKVPLYDYSNHIIGILGIYSDITERKKMEEALFQAKAAEAANKAKTEFLENMSHDIRTPLTGIVGLAEIIKEEKNNSKIKEYASDILTSSYVLLNFLNEILEAICVTSGEMPIQKVKFELKKLLADIVTLNQPKAKEKNLGLTLEYNNNLPDYMIGDARRIQRIILGLVTNALNFSYKGSVTISASLAKKEENREIIIKLVVADTGIGIHPDKQQEIFHRFKRLTPSYQGVYKGAGLGLAIVKQFIDELDGEIYVESALQKGTTFTCLIPLKVALIDDASGASVIETNLYRNVSVPLLREATADTTFETSNVKTLSQILLVEDNPIAAKIAISQLETLGCVTHHVVDGKSGIAMAKKEHYDLILMDLGLPDINGMDVTRHIRLSENGCSTPVPIIALTAHADESSKQQCIQAGINTVLSKPLSEEAVRDVLNIFIPHRKKYSSALS